MVFLIVGEACSKMDKSRLRRKTPASWLPTPDLRMQLTLTLAEDDHPHCGGISTPLEAGNLNGEIARDLVEGVFQVCRRGEPQQPPLQPVLA